MAVLSYICRVKRFRIMKRRLIITALPLLLSLAMTGQSLDECQRAAERNYPLIRQMGLVAKTRDLSVENIAKGWLPQISASAQATYQSDVATWPDQVRGFYQQMGIDMEGLRRDQYRVGIDVQQTVYDGGSIRSQKETARRQGNVEAAQTEVTLYQIRQRVNEMYFGLLLLDRQMELNADLQRLLQGNEEKLLSMFRSGTAAESDYLAVKAERLSTGQKMTDLEAQRQSLARLLSAFCGIEVGAVEMPQGASTNAWMQGAKLLNGRPELRLINERTLLTEAQERELDTRLRPRLSVFAQGFYGYPGYNMFEDMMHRNWSLNGMVGARLSWNIGALYTRKNEKAKLATQREMLDVERETFLFNNRLEQMERQDDWLRMERVMADDEEIIKLRTSVRKAAESKLQHGIIDVNDLVREINNENAARVLQQVHKIEMTKEIYDLKYTTNN